MKIGIFGGAFDPPHIAHTLSCLYALETSDIEQIWVIPCYKHAFAKDLTGYSHRVEMCRIAMKCFGDKVIISEIESERTEISYTIDTLKILKERNPQDTFTLIIGTDILAEIDKWKDFDKIKEIAEVLVLPRPIDKNNLSEENFFMPNISSRMIRELLKNNKDSSQFLSKKVLQYIKENHLYK